MSCWLARTRATPSSRATHPTFSMLSPARAPSRPRPANDGLAMKFVQQLFGHYKMYHQHGPLMLTYAGILGAIGFPMFYLLRFTKATLPYDDLPVRLAGALLCLLLLLKNY